MFFTRNGKKLEDAFIGFNKFNLFPTVGANGACEIHVNFGQAGFVFIEANVKKWGLAPMGGTLAPPPAYGSEGGSVLLEFGGVRTVNEEGVPLEPRPSSRRRRAVTPPITNSFIASSNSNSQPSGSTSAASAFLNLNPPNIPSNRPVNPSPLRQSTRTPISPTASGSGSGSSSIPFTRTLSEDSEDGILRNRNPPTPGALDISLRSIHAFPQSNLSDSDDEEREFHSGSDEGEEENENLEEEAVVERVIPTTSPVQTRIVLPPAYNPIDPHVSSSPPPSIDSD